MTADAANSRRNFLRHAGLLGAGALAGLTAGGGSVAAIEPIRRTGGANLKLSVAAYSYRELLQGRNATLTLLDFIDDCAKMNVHGTELTSYYFPQPVTTEYLCELKHRCFAHGLDVSGTAVGNDFCHPPGPERDRQITSVKQWIEHAALLGAPVIRIFAGTAKAGQTAEQSQRLAVEAIDECCEHAGRHGVFLALENHGGITGTADQMLALVQAVKSRWFGVNLDTGNFHTEDIYGDLARLAPYSINVQLKVVIQPAGGRKQPADFNRIAAILRQAGYRGYVALEFEEPGDPRVECARYIEQMRTALA